jgi:hypothetical protein
VASRVLKRTWGVALREKTLKGTPHADCAVEHMRRNGQLVPYCSRQTFSAFAIAGTSVPVDCVVRRTYWPTHDGQIGASIVLHSSSDPHAAHIADAGVRREGSMAMTMPLLASASLEANLARSVDVQFKFGGTHIQVEARDSVSRQRLDVRVQFLKSGDELGFVTAPPLRNQLPKRASLRRPDPFAAEARDADEQPDEFSTPLVAWRNAIAVNANTLRCARSLSVISRCQPRCYTGLDTECCVPRRMVSATTV